MQKISDGYRLSPIQSRVWSLSTEGDRAAFRSRLAVLIEGPIDMARFQEAVSELVSRFEIFRTHFREMPGTGRPLQYINETLRLEISLWNCETDRCGGHAATALSLFEKLETDPLDLGEGQSMRMAFTEIESERTLWLTSASALCADEVTLHNLVRHTIQRYANGQDPQTEDEAPLQYVDVSEWLHEALESEEAQLGRQYWASRRPERVHSMRAPFQDGTGDRRFAPKSYEIETDCNWHERLRHSAERFGVAAETYLLACWILLLRRHCGISEVTLGLGEDGRDYEELAKVFGPFAKQIPLSLRLDEGFSFQDAIAAVDRSRSEHAEWREFFDWRLFAQDESEDEGPSVHYFPLAFTIAPPFETFSAKGLCVSCLISEAVEERFAVRLAAALSNDCPKLKLQYDPGEISPEGVRVLARQLLSLVEDAGHDPGAPFGTRNAPHAWEIQRLNAFSRSEAPAAASDLIHQRIERQALITPEHPAVVFHDATLRASVLTYGELERIANRTANRLREMGVTPGDRVGLCMTRSLEMIVGMVAIFKAGAAYVPIDSDYPQSRIDFMVKDAAPAALITQDRLVAKFTSTGLPLLAFDRDRLRVEACSDRAPASTVPSGLLAYLIYTSGSTGTPKGVGIPHRALAGYVDGVLSRLALEPKAELSALSTMAADLGNTAVFGALGSGRTLRILPETAGMDARLLEQLLSHRPLHCLKIVPSHLSAFLMSPQPVGLLPQDCLVLGGESLEPSLIQRIRQLRPACRVINHYGPTETTVGATSFEAPPGDCRHLKRMPIGRPFGTAAVYVVDDRFHRVSIGVSGELAVGGDTLAQGYWGRPARTAERFAPDPFSSVHGARLYKTGDLVRFNPDGVLMFLGRVDDQVKIRGFRVEPSEVERVLSDHPDLRETVVIARKDSNETMRLIAYAVARPGSGAEAESVKQWLSAKIPEHMVPAAVLFVAAMPLTLNGKIDRKALPHPELALRAKRGYVAPRTPLERRLAEIWGALLGLDKVGIHDNFFEIGGDSIICLQMASRAKRIGLQLSPNQVLRYPTLAELTQHAAAEPVQAVQKAVLGRAPLTPVQGAFFIKNPVDPNHYNQAFMLTASSPVDLVALNAAARAVMNHHDVLRSRFVHTSSGWIQQFEPEIEADPLERVDLSATPAATRQATLERAAASQQTSLNLAEGPLARFIWFDLGEGEPGRFFIVIHHLAVDGVSWRILFEDLTHAYEQALSLEPPSLPPKTTAYKSWAEALLSYARSTALQAEAPFWHEDNQPVPKAPQLDLAGGMEANRVASAVVVVRSLEPEDTAFLLSKLPAIRQVDVQETLLTALALTLSRWTGDTAVGIALEGHGREDIFPDIDLSRTVGWFSSVYPLLLEAPVGRDSTALLSLVKRKLRAIPNKGLGYGVLRCLASPETARPLAPLPSVVFNYLGRFDQTFSTEGPFKLVPESTGLERSGRQIRDFLLAFSGIVVDDRLWLECAYSRNLHTAETVERLMSQFLQSLKGIIEKARADDRDRLERTPAASEAREHWSALVPIREKGGEPPLFLVHGGAGSVLMYAELAARLPAGRPVYGLQPHGLVAGQEPDRKVADMAQRYFEEIKTVQPDGPYFLAGWSLGGLIAFEMACQARDAGAEVGFLGLFDATAPTVARDRAQRKRRDHTEVLLEVVELMLGQPAKAALDSARLRELDSLGRLGDAFSQLARAGLLPQDMSREEALRLVALGIAHTYAGDSHEPYRAFDGTVALFRASDDKDSDAEADPTVLEWRQRCTVLELHPVPGGHRSMFARPHVVTTAQCLARCLSVCSSPGK